MSLRKLKWPLEQRSGNLRGASPRGVREKRPLVVECSATRPVPARRGTALAALWSRTRTQLLVTFGLLSTAGLTIAVVASAQSAQARYPYDPACAWGRVANGKGMLVRCLSEQEAVQLVQKQSPSTAPAGDREKGAPDKPDDQTDGKPTDQTDAAEKGPLKVEVGPIKADKGKLSIGRLHIPKDRYAGCVAKHGGIEGDDAEVHVRFLVRGDRSRAEGVSVSKRRNMSKQAAKCVADVVDRRRVGTPDAPLVGATLIIKFSR